MSGIYILPLILAATIAVISSGIFITKTGHAVPLQVCSAVMACVGSGLLYTLEADTPLSRQLAYQIIGALGWGAGFQIPAIICQALGEPEDISSVTAVVLCKYDPRKALLRLCIDDPAGPRYLSTY